jgi:hypothetical protein
MTPKQVELSTLALVTFLLLAGVPYFPTAETQENSRTYTNETTTAVGRTTTVYVTQCSNSACPIVDGSSALFKGYSTMALDVTVTNPTDRWVYNLAVRFNYWGPYTCPTCQPDYTMLISFPNLPPRSSQNKHMELQNTQVFRQPTFRYAFQIESFQNQYLLMLTSTSTSSTTSFTTLTTTRYSAA